MKYRFVICDVFTDARFCGNPLAVLPAASGLDASQMQRIAREFNFSESTFVLPPERGGLRRVRIFTPSKEVPFAGHPNVGTAVVLTTLGEADAGTTIVFEEQAGDVPVTIERGAGGALYAELRAPGALTVGAAADPALVAAVLSLPAEAVVTVRHPPRSASVGLPFLMTEVVDTDALARARIDHAALDSLRATGACTDIHVYTRTAGDALSARMFAPDDGVPEDAATGSANVALAALLADLEPADAGEFCWTVTQGVEMGRPSRLECRVSKRNGEIDAAYVRGQAVWVADGEIDVG
ncbi:MAG: PhzF family phenazine biosynthesis protein [Pseudomonadota bacterium]